MASWGLVVPAGKVAPFVPPPEGHRLHLSQATLVPADPAAAVGRAVVFARTGGGAGAAAEVAVASLRGDGKGAECVGLDLIYDEYTEFRVAAADGGGGARGECAVHLAGYYLPDFDADAAASDDDEYDSDDDVSSDSDDDVPAGVPIAGLAKSDDDDGSDESDGDGDSDALSDSDDGGDAAARAAQGVVIEELPPDGDGDGKAGARALPAAGVAAVRPDGDGDESDASDDDDASDDASDDDSAATGSDDDADDEPPAPAPEWGAAAGKRKASSAGGAAPPAKKAAPAAPAAAAPATPAAKPVTAKAAAKAQAAEAAAKTAGGRVRRYDNGFVVEEVTPGRPGGKRAAPGSRVEVRYVGRLAKGGKVFDATKGAATFKFRVGVGEVIKAWDRGVAGAVEGAKLRITAPPSMAYGSSGVRGAIPPNATLVFDVDVVRVF